MYLSLVVTSSVLSSISAAIPELSPRALSSALFFIFIFFLSRCESTSWALVLSWKRYCGKWRAKMWGEIKGFFLFLFLLNAAHCVYWELDEVGILSEGWFGRFRVVFFFLIDI